MTDPALVLASASQIRAALLRSAGVAVEIHPARIDEDAVKRAMLLEEAPPRDIADMLADLKSRRIADRFRDRLVLGVDQVLVCGDRLFDKPEDVVAARRQLAELRGKTHSLLSAAVIHESGRPVWRFIGRAEMTMRPFSDAFLDDYVDRHGHDLCATVGCYKLEEDGAALFSRVSGDYFSILGLPLLEVLAFLRTRGLARE